MSHKDLEYEIECERHKLHRVADDAAVAFGLAAIHAACGCEVDVNVLVYSEAGALAYGGEDAVERYKEDREASVFEQFVVRVTSQGRIP